MNKKRFEDVNPHPNFAEMEEEILKFWEDNKIFEKSLERTKGGKGDKGKKGTFVFFDGPPFATGLPHYGHLLASTIKDLVPRYQTMKGRFVRRRWGWDCHGLPIEEIVERELGISGKKDIEEKIGIKKFNETCRSMVLRYADEWGKFVKRIARWVEFDSSYKTMDMEYMESVWWAFKQIYDKGLVYEGRKVLLYCPRCETPISNFEVAMDNSYQTITEESVIVKFCLRQPLSQPLSSPGERGLPPLERGGIKGEVDTYFLSWTTTPWTLPGNVALAVGPEIEYSIISDGNENYIIAGDLIDKFSTKGGSASGGQITNNKSQTNSKFEILNSKLKGKDLVGLEYEPLYEIRGVTGEKGAHKVYPADFVNTEEGTGIVHTAVVYGEEDYELGQREGLPVVPLLDEKGIFNEKAPELVRGKYFKDSEKLIKDDLEKRGLLFERKSHEHSYPHCWRCGSMLFYNAIPSWFIKISKIKNQILKSNTKEINWYPEHLKFGRYAKSVESAPDWNISRNRYWGNPIPVWVCGQGHHTVIGNIDELADKAVNFDKIYPSWKSQIPSTKSQTNSKFEILNSKLDVHRPYIDEVVLKCGDCGKEARRITEIFDSWFEAASMPFAEYHYPFENKELFESRYPAQFVSEYIAQTRAWFYVMHVVNLLLFGKAPFENVVTTGNVLNDKGEKLSKSKQNYPDPWEVIDKYGVDSLRFYLMNSVLMQADNLNFSEKDLAVINRKVFRILWNIYNYFVTYANAAGWQPLSQPLSSPGERGTLDQWLLAKTQELANQSTELLDKYDTVRYTRLVENYVNDFSTWYVRRSRGREDDKLFEVTRYCLLALSKILAPIMPYISEEFYQNLRGENGGAESVHLSAWPETRELTDEQRDLLDQMKKVREIVEQVHALRAQAGIKLRQPLAKLTLPHNSPSSPLTLRGETPPLSVRGGGEELLDILKDEINVKEIVEGDKLELDTVITPELEVEGLAAELTRQIQQLRKESGLQIGQMAELFYQTESDKIERAMGMVDQEKTYLTEIKRQTLNTRLAKRMKMNGEDLSLFLEIPNNK